MNNTMNTLVTEQGYYSKSRGNNLVNELAYESRSKGVNQSGYNSRVRGMEQNTMTHMNERNWFLFHIIGLNYKCYDKKFYDWNKK